MLRRMVKLGLLVVLGVYLSGCVIVPLHGWGYHGYGHDRGGYSDRH